MNLWLYYTQSDKKWLSGYKIDINASLELIKLTHIFW